VLLRENVLTFNANLKDLVRGIDGKFDQLDGRFDQIDGKFERLDDKIDRLVYFFLGGLVLKGGFDILMNERATKPSHVTKKEK